MTPPNEPEDSGGSGVFIIAFHCFCDSAPVAAQFPAQRKLLALDEKIYELRREKLKQIEALGQPLYRSKYEFTHTVEEILAKYIDKTGEELEKERVNVRVAG